MSEDQHELRSIRLFTNFQTHWAIIYWSRTYKNCQTSDLWTTYFSSSKVVKKLIKEFGKDAFEYEIRKTFETKEETLDYERRLLRKVKAKKNPRFLNKNEGGGSRFHRGGPQSEETKQKISRTLSGRKHSDERKANISLANKGKKNQKEHQNTVPNFLKLTPVLNVHRRQRTKCQRHRN